MRTVPLSGKKAAGRVVRVDDGDYEAVSRHRWFIVGKPATATTRGSGPYAQANIGDETHRRTILMHCLIMGAKGIDHIDHDGLNNQRSNLRLANQSQNAGNQRAQVGEKSSAYKGVMWSSRKRKWVAQIGPDGRSTHLGYFYSELEAAYAYDAAAREAFGEFASTNFPEPPTQAMRDEWQAASAAILAERLSNRSARRSEWLTQREMETHVCTVCGSEYQSRALHPTLYCGSVCKSAVARRRKKERGL